MQVEFKLDQESLRRLNNIFCSYGWYTSILVDKDTAIFFLKLLVDHLVTVEAVPYKLNQFIERDCPKAVETYQAIARETRWRSGTRVELVRIHAFELFKDHGTPTFDSGFIRYEEGKIAVVIANQGIYSLITHLLTDPVTEQFILFPDPEGLVGIKYYIFHFTPESYDLMRKYQRQVMDSVVEKLDALPY